MTAFASQLSARLGAEAACLAAATTPEARERISRRLQSIKQQLAEEKARQSEFNVPRECTCLR